MVANTLLSLSALLLLTGARAHCERGPKVTVTGLITVHKVPDVDTYYSLKYGDDATVFCSYNHTDNLSILRLDTYTKEETNLPAEVHNVTTISSVLKPSLGWYSYFCTDRNSDCMQSLLIYHQPAMSVSSPRVHIQTKVADKLGLGSYFVPHGDDFLVICEGRDSQELHLYKYESEVKTDILNDTAVVYRARADHMGWFVYLCKTEKNADILIMVRVDEFPKVHNFSCIAYEYQNKIECSWRRSNAEDTTFQLFYKENLLCSGVAGESSSGCKWKNIYMGRRLFDDENQNVTLVMNTCSDFICYNQTFTFNYYSIVINVAVFNLNVKDTSSHGAYVSWQDRCYSYNPCSYKVEYRLFVFGETWRKADMSSVRCDYILCEFRLALPYPDSKYEVTVYNKPAAATDDRLWSDPVSISVVTKARAECSCKAGNHEPTEPITTGEASCEACELAEHITENSKALRVFQSNLKQKRDRFLKKIKLIDERNSITSELNSI